MNEIPVLREDNGEVVVLDRRQSKEGQVWRFWGLTLLGGVAVGVMFVPRWQKLDEPIDLLIPLLTAVVGAFMLMVAGKPKSQEIELARILPQTSQILIKAVASELLEGEDRSIWMDEIESIVFGMTRFPLYERKKDIKVEAFTVCLKLFDGAVVPIIEATPDKKLAFDVAQHLGERLSVPVEQAGLGI